MNLTYSEVSGGTFKTSTSFAPGAVTSLVKVVNGQPFVSIDIRQPAADDHDVQRTISLQFNGGIAAGQTLPLGRNGDPGASVLYTESGVDSSGTQTTRRYSTTGGTVSLVSVEGLKVTVRLTDAVFSSFPTTAGYPGTFKLNGTVTVDSLILP